MSLTTFEDLYIRLANEVDNFNRRTSLALAATNYQQIANFSPQNAFEPALRAFDVLHDYYNTLGDYERTVPGIYDRFMNASQTIQLVGERMGNTIVPKLNKLKENLRDGHAKVLFSENHSFSPANDSSLLNDNTALNRAIGPAQLQDKSFLALLTIPNVLLLLCVGLAIRQLCRLTPLNYAVKTLFGKKKEKNDEPVANLADHEAHGELVRLI